MIERVNLASLVKANALFLANTAAARSLALSRVSCAHFLARGHVSTKARVYCLVVRLVIDRRVMKGARKRSNVDTDAHLFVERNAQAQIFAKFALMIEQRAL